MCSDWFLSTGLLAHFKPIDYHKYPNGKLILYMYLLFKQECFSERMYLRLSTSRVVFILLFVPLVPTMQ